MFLQRRVSSPHYSEDSMWRLNRVPSIGIRSVVRVRDQPLAEMPAPETRAPNSVAQLVTDRLKRVRSASKARP